jgi:hypothetical protein
LGYCINALPTEAREVLTFNDYNLDFKAMQLAILARDGGMPFTSQLLAKNLVGSPYDVWEYFKGISGVDDKQAHKTLLYACNYGKSLRNGRFEGHTTEGLKTLATRLLGDKQTADKYLQCELIQECLEYRKVRMDTIIEDGGKLDYFSYWDAIRPVPAGVDYHKFIRSEARRISASNAQSWEVGLMCELLTKIAANKDLLTVDLIHDGCVVHAVNHKHFAPNYLLNIKQEMDSICRGMGISSVMEVKYQGQKLLFN